MYKTGQICERSMYKTGHIWDMRAYIVCTKLNTFGEGLFKKNWSQFYFISLLFC